MNTTKEQNNLLQYIRHQHDIFDYYTDDIMDGDRFIAAIGVVVACNQTTFDRLITYAKRYCPNMKVTSMTIEECILRNQKARE